MLEIIQSQTFKAWLAKLKDKTASALIAARLFRLEEGYLSDTNSLGAGIYELRIHYGAGYRIYYTRHGEQVVVLLCGGDKGSQKRDITQAR